MGFYDPTETIALRSGFLSMEQKSEAKTLRDIFFAPQDNHAVTFSIEVGIWSSLRS